MDVNAPAKLITAPAKLITAPAQPPATGAAVYAAFLDATAHLYKRSSPFVGPSVRPMLLLKDEQDRFFG